MKERKDQNEKIKELTEKLQAGIQELYDSEKYRDYLRTMAKFHHYSFNNSLLIWAQRPDATAVAGYRAWQTKFGRTVNPGAKGIMIYLGLKQRLTPSLCSLSKIFHAQLCRKYMN